MDSIAFPALMCDSVHRVFANKGSSSEPWCPDFLWGAPSRGHSWPSMWLSYVSSPTRGGTKAKWPKAPTLNHIVRLSGMTRDPQVNKNTHIRYDIPCLKDYLPEADGKSQTSFWPRLNSLLFRNKTKPHYKFIKLTRKWRRRGLCRKSPDAWGCGMGGTVRKILRKEVSKLRSEGWDGLARWVVQWRATQG